MKLIAIAKSLSFTKVCSILAVLTLVGCGGSSGGGKKSSSSVSSAASVSSVVSSEAVSSASSVATSFSSSVEASLSSSSEVTSSVISSSSAMSSDESSTSSVIVIVSSASSSSESSSPSSTSSSNSSEESSSSSSSEGSSSSASSVSSNGWVLVWNDEFDGDSIDPSKWDHEENCWGGGNNEQQCYTTQATNSFIEDGVLNIVAIKEDFTGPNDPEGTGGTTATLPYTSARLRTKNLAEWTFGRFEIRAKLPFGQGTWPAIWMLPTNSPYGGWAAGGEIDIMEAVNLKTQTTVDGVLQPPEANGHGTLHYGRVCCSGNVNSGASYTLPEGANPADDFHVYAMEWEDGEIRWYVDGHHFATQRDTGWYSQYMVDGVLTDAPVGAPFDDQSEFHLLLNLAVGGAWAANTNNMGIDETVFPQTMQIDYVRVYECSVSPTTGQGCATIGDDPQIVPGNTRPVIGDVELPGPPLFVMYDDELANGLIFNSYNPDGAVSYSEVEEAGRGNVLNVVKTGANGNVYFQVNGDPTDLRNWSGDSELVFDVKVNSRADGATLLVKLDSGWPNVSDVSVTLAPDGEWAEYRITLADLIDNGNSLNGGSGSASLASIANVFVIDPIGAMDVSFDNVRIEGEANETQFADVPLFEMFGDALADGLQVQSYNPAGQITSSIVAEDGRGSVFNVVKTGAQGNVFFNVQDGPADLEHWAAEGELVFDVKVNSKADGASLLVKMDSGWPNVSDMTVDVAPDGEWKTIRVGVADLIDNGNSVPCCPGMANLAAITNMFVIEPSDAMDVSFDNIRLVVPETYTIYEDDLNADLQTQSYNPDGLVTSTVVSEVDRGNVFNVVKTAGGQGNVYFNITAGPGDLTDWLVGGELVFDYKINSVEDGAYLLIKMDSGWPLMSDVSLPIPAVGEWTEYRISVADLLNDGNHYTSPADKANVTQIVNVFVMEPQAGAMDVSFDNIRLIRE